MKTIHLLFFAALMSVCWTMDASAQVSNDNEFGVNLVDENSAYEHFVPGELIVKFKEETPVRVKRARGRYASTSVSSLDGVLSKYNVAKFDKLLPEEEYKPRAARRSAVAPDGRSVTEHCLDLLFHIQIESDKPDSVMMLVEELKTLEEVEYAEPNYYYYISGAPAKKAINLSTQMTTAQSAKASTTDENVICANPEQNPLYQLQWGIKALNIDQLWNKPIVNSKRPVIAILDTGVDINHPDLKDNIWSNPREAEGERGYDDDGNGFVDDIHGWDFVYDYHEMDDNNSHGTHVAGIAAASDNAIGIIGANPKALIMPVKVMDDNGRGNLAAIIKGINYAAKQGADVINMSLGSQSMSYSMAEALENAYITSVIVAAAGNNYNVIYDKTEYPAAYYCVIGVQATSDAEGNLASFSNYDPDGPIYSRMVWGGDIVRVKDPTVILGINYETKAPGEYILSTVLDGKYTMYNGTSMSSPLVAGAISALKMVKDIPNNDILFTDLAHLDCDFARIYESSPRPSDIYWAGMDIDDDIEGNAYPNGEIDAGETFYLYPILLNGWGDCGKIDIKLEVDTEQNPYVRIDNQNIEFGYTIGTLGHLKSKNPFVVHVSDQLSNDAKIKFLFTFRTDEIEKTHEYYADIRKMCIIDGWIEKDTTFTADKVWYVPQGISIPKGVNLTIEPGTRIEFGENASIRADGQLTACGTPEKPIVFTGYKGAKWSGFTDHQGYGEQSLEGIYCNEDTTIFTLIKTEKTPIPLAKIVSKNWYISENSYVDVQKYFFLRPTLKEEHYAELAYNDTLLRDPEFLTPIVQKLLAEYQEVVDYCEKNYSNKWTEETRNFFNISVDFSFSTYEHPKNMLSYCKISNCSFSSLLYTPVFNNCELSSTSFCLVSANKSNVINSRFTHMNSGAKMSHCNFANNSCGNIVSFGWDGIKGIDNLPICRNMRYGNYINNDGPPGFGHRYYLMAADYKDVAEYPAYFGTSREDLVRPYIWEIGNAPETLFSLDLSNMPSNPDSLTHGILWKIMVNGKDCQDEFEQIEPLGIGTHKVELHFSRPMNVTKNPEISYGLRKPFSTNEISGGSWSSDSLVYSADLHITGKERTDGINRFYVRGAEDNEYFECPHDSVRFNIQIESAGALATGFHAEAKLGHVILKWNNDDNKFDDAMGFNVYRYGDAYMHHIPGYIDEGGIWHPEDSIMIADTIRINKQILPIETTEYSDYDVAMGQTYRYFYRVLSTDLVEYDMSNTVAATPLTAIKGDANGSGNVDVADVITVVNYAANMNPKPFIFEAADINADTRIDILDVVGIIQTIISPESQVSSISDATAIYTVEDGILYVNSPVALAGIQVQLATEQKQEITMLESLKDFEQASAWLSDNDWLFIAYSLSGKTLPAGKTALLNIGNARITDMRLSDVTGKNVKAIGQNVTGVAHMGGDVMHIEGVYNLSGRKLYTNERTLDKLPNGVYIVNGKKVVK